MLKCFLLIKIILKKSDIAKKLKHSKSSLWDLSSITITIIIKTIVEALACWWIIKENEN
jgi:hypothetical protein